MENIDPKFIEWLSEQKYRIIYFKNGEVVFKISKRGFWPWGFVIQRNKPLH